MNKNEIIVEDVLQESIKLPESLFGMDRFNNSHFFLGPLFDIKSATKHKHNYVGCYIGDRLREHSVERPLFCLCKFATLDGDEYSTLSKYFLNHKNFKFNYYAGMNNGYNLIMFVLTASDDISSDYDKLVNGKYSQVSTEYRKRIGSYPFQFNTRRRLCAIIMQEDWHRTEMEDSLGMRLDGELWGRFEPARETFRYAKDI